MNKAPDHTAGFTLLEVLIALAILAIAVGSATGTLSGSAAWLAKADMEERAVTTANSTLARVGVDIPIVQGTYSGQEGAVTWVVTISSPLSDPAPIGNFAAYPITVAVTWISGGAIKKFQLQSVSLGPYTNSL